MDIPVVRRVRKRRRMADEETSDVGLSYQDEIKREMFEVIDRLKTEIHGRFEHMKVANDKFGFLQLDFLLKSDNDEVIDKDIDGVAGFYDEINAEELKQEIRRLRRFILLSVSDDHDKKLTLDTDNRTIKDILTWIVKWGLTEMLPNLTILLRIYLTLCVSVATCERSFSKLKLVKTYLRSQMSHSRLTSLAVLSIERELAEKLNFDDVIRDFATRKARKVNLR
jgi:hypothetical protein